MNFNGYFVLGLVAVGIIASETEGKLTCFRKIKRNGKCAGIIRKTTFDTAEVCCDSNGAGYALRKQKVGKNRFRCEPCVQESLLRPTKLPKVRKTPKPKNKKKAKKEKKHNKEKDRALPKPKSKPKPEIPTTGAPQIEIRPHDNWFTPVKRTDISYSYSNLNPEKAKIRWGPWSPCSVTCGAGWRSRFKVCDDCDKNDYENVQSQPCMVNFYCPVDGNWGPWFPWQPCSQSCGGGSRVRQRKCNYPPPAYGGLSCPGEGENDQICNDQSCPVDGKWSSWSAFSLCSVTCGQGTVKKTRACDNPAPAHGGKTCHGSPSLTKKCKQTNCPQDGGWSLWGTWSQCAVTCGEGTSTRTRACDSPRALYGGKECVGEPIEKKACSGGRPCPVDGGWSEWTNFGFCRAARCGLGFQVRSRSCTEPRPVHGGRPCDGDQYERVECVNDLGCPKNGSWCEWGRWSKCTASCQVDTALQVRQRECKCPQPKNGGAECDGEGIEVKTCENLPSCASEVPSARSDTRAEGEREEEEMGQSGDGAGDHEDQDGSEGEDYADHTELEGN